MLAAGTIQKRDDGTCDKRDGEKERKGDAVVVLRARGPLSEKVRVLVGKSREELAGEEMRKSVINWRRDYSRRALRRQTATDALESIARHLLRHGSYSPPSTPDYFIFTS